MQRTPVSYTFLILCLLVSIPGTFSEQYFELFSGELPHEYWWQNFTMAFQHGSADQPVSIFVHLGLNTILMLACGMEVEKVIGSSRFLILTFIAWAGFIFTQWISGLWINGSSGIIWAYSPFLLLHVKWAKNHDSYQAKADRSKGILILMWLIVTLFMGFVPFIFNPSHELWYTFIFGNLFHTAATTVGFVMYFLWKREIKPD